MAERTKTRFSSAQLWARTAGIFACLALGAVLLKDGLTITAILAFLAAGSLLHDTLRKPLDRDPASDGFSRHLKQGELAFRTLSVGMLGVSLATFTGVLPNEPRLVKGLIGLVATAIFWNLANKGRDLRVDLAAGE